MAVGQFLEQKFTWLLDDVEIRGRVLKFGEDNNPGGDVLDVVPDQNYQHLISLFRGNNPLLWEPVGTPGDMHCETYLLDSLQVVSRVAPFPVGAKPDGSPFVVKDRSGGPPRALQVDDHIRFLGRWVIDHHPELCNPPSNRPPHPTSPTFPYRCRDRGLLKVGPVHTEFHPFRWDDIHLVDARNNDVDVVTLSLAAPIHEEQYLDGAFFPWDAPWSPNYFAGVQRRVFIADDSSNFHPTMSADITLDGPPMDADFMSDRGAQWKLLRCLETVVVNGTGLPLDRVRTIFRSPDHVRVTATVIAPGGLGADVLDPTNDRSVFQARYSLQWSLIGSQITCINKPRHNDPNDRIHAIGGVLNDGTPWQISLDEAIAIIDQGGSFYVENPPGDRAAVVVAVSALGHRYLKTVADRDLPNNLLSLPECNWIS